MPLESYLSVPGLSPAGKTPCAQQIPGANPSVLTPTEICCESKAS